MSRKPQALVAALALAVFVACGTTTPVGVDHIDAASAERVLHVNALSAGKPSAETLQVVLRRGQYERWEDDPAGTLADLHARLLEPGGSSLLLPLAELSFLHGAEEDDRRYFLAAAVYAYAYSFSDRSPGPPGAADPALRLALDLYNRGLARGFGTDTSTPVEIPASGTFELPFGTLTLDVSDQGFTWGGRKIERVTSAIDYRVRGLRNRYRTPGIGAALNASLVLPKEPPDDSLVAFVAPRLKVPVSALVRLEDPGNTLASGNLRGKLEIYFRDDATTVTIGKQTVPLEFEPTAALAYSLEGAKIYDVELAAFFSGVVRAAQTGSVRTTGLVMLHPYRPGRMPVVLVHGTASSSARWAELVNELENDPRFFDRFQIWLFNYNTGNPIAYSGGVLRQALLDTVAALDPQGKDPALRAMVVMGHSQGGLLTKTTAIDSGDLFWSNVTKLPFDEIKADDATRALLRRSLFFTPLPFVRRVIFVATPHGGSYLASFSVAGLVRDFITLPGDLAGRLTNLALDNEGKTAISQLGGRLPTSLDNMTPGNPFIKTLSSIPVRPPIHVHSIVAVKGDGAPEGQSDGVVKYESAHIEPVDSELIVRSSHSTQDNPATIEEIRRILHLHAEQAGPLPKPKKVP